MFDDEDEEVEDYPPTILPKAEFINMVGVGYLTDDDGYGYPHDPDTGKSDSKIVIGASDYKRIPPHVTHIEWINK